MLETLPCNDISAPVSASEARAGASHVEIMASPRLREIGGRPPHLAVKLYSRRTVPDKAADLYERRPFTAKTVLLNSRHGAAEDFRNLAFVEKRLDLVHVFLKQSMLPESMAPFPCT
jgi:hypothetical protein